MDEDYDVEYLEYGTTYESGYGYCRKKDTHTKYVPPNELSLEHLPANIRDPKLLEFIKVEQQLTGLVKVKAVRHSRSAHLCGSCIVQKIEEIRKLRSYSDFEDEGEAFYQVTVATVCHVIPTDEAAESCTVQLFYDNQNSDAGQKIMCGIKRHTVEVKGDWCALVCRTNDTKLVTLLRDLLTKYWALGCELQEKYANTTVNLVIIVSHPHGGPKLVSFGEMKDKTKKRQVRDGQEWCQYSYTAPTCRGSSGGPVYILGQWSEGFGFWFGHAHNHSRYINKKRHGQSSVGVRLT
ncbi:hypothetical protein BsWGS_21952 [Bradybaena similaris]